MSLTIRKKKAIQTINYLIELSGGVIDCLRIFKLIWFADRCNMMRYGRMIVRDPDKDKAVSDMVINSIFYDDLDVVEFFYYKEKKLYSIKPTDLDHLSKSDIAILDEVHEYFKDFVIDELEYVASSLPESSEYSDIKMLEPVDFPLFDKYNSYLLDSKEKYLNSKIF